MSKDWKPGDFIVGKNTKTLYYVKSHDTLCYIMYNGELYMDIPEDLPYYYKSLSPILNEILRNNLDKYIKN